MEEEVKPKKKNWQSIIGVAVGVGVMTAVVNLNRTDPYNKLVEVTEENNKKGPFMVDAETRIDSTWAIKDPLTIVYDYTIISANKDSLSVDLNDIKKTLTKQTQDMLDNEPGMATFRRYNVSMKYNYKDKKGKSLFDFTIKPTNVE